MHAIATGLGVACLALAAAGCLYTLVAIAVVRRFARSAAAPGRSGRGVATPGITILKALSGAEPHLGDDLASFCEQDYGGPVEIVFGVRGAADPAADVVRSLMSVCRGRDVTLAVHASAHGENPKIALLAELEPRVRHDVVIVADADIGVPRDYLRETIAALQLPKVGAVTLLYRGVARGGLWARLAAMGIDYHFYPSVLVGLALGLARPCFGSTIALRRETLVAIGGFRAFEHRLADDNAIGESVRAMGLRVAIPPLVVAHSCSERSAAELWRHELRWARTTRAVSPLGYAGSLVMHPLPLALLGAALAGFAPYATATLAAAALLRLVLQRQVDHTLRVPSDRWRLGPLRDVLAFGVHLAAYFVNVVGWRGRRYRVRPDGTLTSVGEP